VEPQTPQAHRNLEDEQKIVDLANKIDDMVLDLDNRMDITLE